MRNKNRFPFVVNAVTILLLMFVILPQTSCDSVSQASTPTQFVSPVGRSATVVTIDMSPSSRKTFAIPTVRPDDIYSLVRTIAVTGGGDLLLYVIDEDARDNAPFFMSVPAIPVSPAAARRNIGDESYESDRRAAMKKFQADSIAASAKVSEVINNNATAIESFLKGAYTRTTVWTDATGIMNSAVQVLSSTIYDHYAVKNIINFSDLEQSMPSKSKYKPELIPVPQNIHNYMVAGTSGQSPIIDRFTRVASLSQILSVFN